VSPAVSKLRRAKGQRKGKAHRRGIHPLVIAALAIGLTAAVTYYAFAQGVPFQHKFTMYALVNNSVNVRSDSPVRIAGIDVGVVQGVSPAGSASKVAFTLDDNGLPVHKDATVTIRDSIITRNQVAPSATVHSGLPCGSACPFALAGGGGIDNWGRMTLTNTVVSNNRAGGPITSDALRKHGRAPDVEAASASIESLLDAIIEAF